MGINEKSMPVDSHIEKVDKQEIYDASDRRQSLITDTDIEHELTFREVLRNHKRLIWWCFYFAMCAIGW
jgi:hypothetical protein